jgi:hypothetical protein
MENVLKCLFFPFSSSVYRKVITLCKGKTRLPFHVNRMDQLQVLHVDGRIILRRMIYMRHYDCKGYILVVTVPNYL